MTDLLGFASGALVGAIAFWLGRWSMRRDMLRSGEYWPIDYEALRQSVEDERNGIRGYPIQEVFEELRTRERPEVKG
jgi:hypothetical protein